MHRCRVSHAGRRWPGPETVHNLRSQFGGAAAARRPVRIPASGPGIIGPRGVLAKSASEARLGPTAE